MHRAIVVDLDLERVALGEALGDDRLERAARGVLEGQCLAGQRARRHGHVHERRHGTTKRRAVNVKGHAVHEFSRNTAAHCVREKTGVACRPR